MTAPNRSTLWGRTIVSELAASGVEAVCAAPGSRSTPLTAAAAAHDDLTVFSHLDERSAAYFALGRGRATGEPTALVCTSGTAAANFHPAVIEADEAGVPLLVLTADRPAELQDSGANQTVDQTRLYGDAVRAFRTLPEPAPEPRRLRSLRVSVDRGVAATTGADPGPVHLNVPLSKPLEPTPTDEVPADVGRDPLSGGERTGPFVDVRAGTPTLAESDLDAIASAVDDAARGLIVCGPATSPAPGRDALAALAEATGFPVLADPLSGHRYGPHLSDVRVCGGYDSYLDGADDWPDPDVVVRFGASPTSKTLRHYLRDSGARQFVVSPAGNWPEAEFAATDLVGAAPSDLAVGLADRVQASAEDWADRFARAEADYWTHIAEAVDEGLFEGAVLHAVSERAPDPAAVFVSNSMPVRDLDRFGRPRAADLSVHANRGASGIDGITSTALGVGSVTDDPLVLVTGDLAFYHDMNGLLALQRCDVDATIVLVNNDGGGIFHMLPIEDHDPPFTEQFKTPHGLDFEPTGDLYGFDFERVRDLPAFEAAFTDAVGNGDTTVVEVVVDAEASHRRREALHERVCERVS